MLHRLRADFHLSVITLLGASAVFGIVPFAVYRFLTRDYVAGVVDIFILLGIIVPVVYAWRTGDTRRTGIVLALISCGGGFTVATLLGDVGIFWLYPPFITCFFLVKPLEAVLINGLTMSALAIHNVAFDSTPQMFSFLTTSLVVSACAYIFANRHEFQRRQLEKLAELDPLTGVKNRRAMEQELQHAATVASENGMSYGLVMLDLDHFKQINDTHGHHVGDQVLVQLTSLISEGKRRSDHLYRFGGEEFVLLLPGVDIVGIRSVVNNLHQRILTHLKGPGGTVTASLGAALLKPGECWRTWLERADQALYRAKAEGRNRVVIDGIGPEPVPAPRPESDKERLCC